MRVLAFETTADDTGAAIIEESRGKFKILANVVISQTRIHRQYGGIKPTEAGKAHLKNIGKACRKALAAAGAKSGQKRRAYISREVDAIAVAYAPGLMPGLLVGSAFARTLSWRFNKPLIGVHHLEGHIYSAFLTRSRRELVFPALALVVSGGHTELVAMRKIGHFKILGKTRDDAAGEAFDKVGKLLGFPYPAGPAVEKAARAVKTAALSFSPPMLKSEDLDFSFAGLKTAVLYKKQTLEKEGALSAASRRELAFAFQEAVLASLTSKTIRACQMIKAGSFLLGGGVAANQALRRRLTESLKSLPRPPRLFFADLEYTSDNAAMIGLAGILRARAGLTGSWRDFPAQAKLPLKTWKARLKT